MLRKDGNIAEIYIAIRSSDDFGFDSCLILNGLSTIGTCIAFGSEHSGQKCL